jgi:hypothetical protein
VDDKLTESRERYGRQHLPRLFSGDADDKQSEIRERYLGIGVAMGSAFGLAIGAGFGVALGNLAWGIGFGLCIGTGIGIALGAAWGNRQAKAMRKPSGAGGRRNA